MQLAGIELASQAFSISIKGEVVSGESWFFHIGKLALYHLTKAAYYPLI